MADDNKSRDRIPAAPVRRDSGTVAKPNVVSFDDALAKLRQRTGSEATGPATEDEQRELDAIMAADGHAFEPAEIDYRTPAKTLGMTEAELRALVAPEPSKPSN